MKSFFIKNTNEQYSIREDGVIIIHYKLTWKNNKTKVGINKVMKLYNKRYSTISINNQNVSLSINTLLLEYFGFKYCTSCNNKIKDGEKCNDCKKLVIKNYNKKSRTKYKQKKITKERLEITFLSDNYIKNNFKLPSNISIPQEIIKAKRQQLLLHRQLKTI